MPARTITDEESFRGTPFDTPILRRRREVLRETAFILSLGGARLQLHEQAAANLARWRKSALLVEPPARPQVLAGDWGDVTAALTRKHGAIFAVLNMANARYAGGGYIEGAAAQEENMFRRTDCHVAVERDHHVGPEGMYTAEGTALVEGRLGRVHLDAKRPRVCFRASEDRLREDLGYARLPDEEVFPFFEVRAAAQDLRGGVPFDEDNARRRIEALLETIIADGIRHVVLGALGCGAFENPSAVVAGMFREALEQRQGAFDVVAFAIHHAGYGPGNYPVFASEFS